MYSEFAKMNNWYSQAYIPNIQGDQYMQASYLSYFAPEPAASNPSDLDRIAVLEEELQTCQKELLGTKEALALVQMGQVQINPENDPAASQKESLQKINSNTMCYRGQTLELDGNNHELSISSGTPLDFEALKRENAKLKRKLTDAVDNAKSMKKIIKKYDLSLKGGVETLSSSRKELQDLTQMVEEFEFADSDEEESLIVKKGSSFDSQELHYDVPKGFLDSIAKITDEDLAELRNME